MSRRAGAITSVNGVQVGHFTDPRRPTGCTVVLVPEGAVAAVDVRGAAPGTRETDLLAPGHLVDKVHAVLLSGGSAWGLDAASGVVRWLEEQGHGLDLGVARLPLVPAAVLFDLTVGNAAIRPDAAAGYAACAAASCGQPAEGNVGAGAGASVGKLFGMARAMKGGIGTASVTLRGVTVGAIVACNAVGDVIDPGSGRIVAGARRSARGKVLLNTQRALLRGQATAHPLTPTNTTIGVIATDAALSRTQLQRLATQGHDGLARCIAPVHTALDGDTLFALATGKSTERLDLLTLGAMAAQAVTHATLRAVQCARRCRVDALDLPAANDLSDLG